MAAAATPSERAVYEAGFGRKFFLSLAFLILLPFFASLPAMLISRLIHGLWFDTIGLIIFSALFTALMALLAVQLYQSLRSRVELGDASVKLTLPQGSGATPMLRFVSTELPYDQIDRIETRCVLFGRTFAPVLLRATRIVTKDGRHVRLGNVNEDTSTLAPRIGARLRSAPASLVDGGRCAAPSSGACWALIVRNGPRYSRHHRGRDAEINGRHSRAMRYLVIASAGGVVRVAIDVFTAPTTSFALVGTSGPSKK
jgi:hypothetical protein